ncbi:MAG: hypothetical protein CME06_03205 [Gemmatimonadetes bacterium]|nr:hypothetical protein [Gemmatimonadota bacterium]
MVHDVSVIIPVRNRRAALQRCLDSIPASVNEIVVVDNGSTDGTLEWLRDQHANVRIVENEENRGAAEAKNQGVRASRGEYVWFLDSDTVIPESFRLEHAGGILDADSTVGAVGGEIVVEGDRGKLWRVKVLLANGETETLELASGYGGLRDVDYMPSCNMLMRRIDFDRLGGFDPAYFFLVEDTDLCWRIRRMGRRCVVDDASAVIHEIDTEARRGDLFLVHRNRIRFAALHFSPARLILLPLLDLLYLFKPWKLRSLRRGSVSTRKHISPRLRALGSRPWAFPLQLGAVASALLWALARAYLWNLRHAVATWRTRMAR